MTTPRLPFEIREALVAACGKCFWLKDPFKAYLLSCGLDEAVYARYADESKYKIARHVLAELDAAGDDGYEVQRRLVTELCKLRKLPDDNVPDRNAGLEALRRLKELALENKLVIRKEELKRESRVEEARKVQAAVAARAGKMEELRTAFNTMARSADDPQSRGYGLEDLLGELFAVHEIQYRRPYKTSTEQIDGHFTFKGFDYLVEARWRATPPREGDLGAFKLKVDKKITSTRGVFFSIVGFREEVVAELTRAAEGRDEGEAEVARAS